MRDARRVRPSPSAEPGREAEGSEKRAEVEMGLLDFTQECLDAAEGTLPKDERGKRPLRLQVYKNAFIERWFAQAHPITPGIWFGWVVVYGIYVGLTTLTWWETLLAFVGGVLITTMIEYGLHRFAFHYEPKTAGGRLQHFLLHGYHHEFPNDPMRLVLPPIGIWPVAAVIATLYYFAFGPYFWTVFGGTCLAYIAYDWTHYYTHHFNPKTGLGKWIKKYHMLHHFDSPNHRFGITSPLWDLVLGTYLPTDASWRKIEKERASAAR
jgi:sterol desaturase/sphingolipid hydroxylase (fatty acid hydroxylase superfamily)